MLVQPFQEVIGSLCIPDAVIIIIGLIIKGLLRLGKIVEVIREKTSE